MNERVTESVMLDKLASDLNLEIIYTGRGVVPLSSMSVERPGLQLAGFFSYFDPRRIMVFGLSEHEYLRSFSSEERREKLSRLFDYGEVPCIILSRDLPSVPELMEVVRKASCPLFRSPKVTTDLMSDLYIYLNRMLAPSVTEHGVLMEVFGVGMLLTGKSGVGKSETAMELIKRGHRLIADDSVIIKEIANDLYGTAPEIIRYFIELRGIGIVNALLCQQLPVRTVTHNDQRPRQQLADLGAAALILVDNLHAHPHVQKLACKIVAHFAGAHDHDAGCLFAKHTQILEKSGELIRRGGDIDFIAAF